MASALLIALLTWSSAASAALVTPVYHYTFDSDSSAGANVGTASGGSLTLNNSASGGVAFSSSGGVSGGTLNATSGQIYNQANHAGAATSTLGVLSNTSAITVTMWVKLSASSLTTYARLFSLGADDVGAANSIGLALNGAGKLNLYLNGSDTTNMLNLGPELAADTWYFIAISYDGASSSASESQVQQTATGGADARNTQLYIGTVETGSLSRTGVKVGTGQNYNTSRGSINFSSTTASWFANRKDLARGLNGFVDDIRIYNTVLSAAELDTVRLGAASIPESGVSALLVAAAVSLTALARRQSRRH